MRYVVPVVLFTLLPAAVLAQPLVANRGIYNAASYMSYGLPGGSIAQGSLFSLFGSNLGPASSPPLAFPLSSTLGGVSIQVIQGTTTVNAIPVYVSPAQINAIMPSNAPLGAVSIRVNYIANSPPVRANIVNASFGIFSVNSAGFGPGVMQNYVSGANVPINAPAHAAKPGQTIILYGTGLGPGLNADNQAPQAGNLATKVEVFVGGKLGRVAYGGRSSCCSALDQINFVVPADAPLGCWVPLQVRTNSTTVSNTVTMAISADGSPCADPLNALSKPFLAGQKFGLVALLRSDITEDVGLATAGTVTTDNVMMTFQQQTATTFAFSPFFSLPPAGTCTAYTSVGDLFDGDTFSGADANAKFLNAGASLTLTGPADFRSMKRPADNTRNFQPLGYTYTGSLVPSTLFFKPGDYVLTGPSGSDVGLFQTKFTLPSPFELTWTNRNQTLNVVRSDGFTVNWTGAPSGQPVIIFGGGVDTPTNSSALFACVAPPGASSFTVPAEVLANIAPTRTNLLKSKAAVYVGALPASNPIPFTAPGIDFGAVMPGAFAGKTVIFQ